VSGSLSRGLARLGFRKNVDKLLAEAHSESGLAKTLGARDLVILGVAGIIGAGIFVLIGQGVAAAGVAVVPAFVVSAIICAFAGFAYAELAAAIPASGSAYAYIYTALGELPGWLVAWALILEYAVGAIDVAIGWRSNLLALVNQIGRISNHDPLLNYFEGAASYGLTHSPLESATASNGTLLHGWINLPSILIVLLVTALLVRGTKESARFTTVLVAIKVAILLLAIGVGFALFHPGNLDHGVPCYDARFVPCFAPGFSGTPHYDATGLGAGFQAVFAAAAIMFFAYIGFDSVSTTAEETRNPKKDLPVGILGSLGVTTFLYVLAALALVGAANWTTFVGSSTAAKDAVEEPFGFVFEQAGYGWAAILVRVGALIGTTSVLLVLILGGVRVFFNMSRDGLLPAWMSRVSARGNPSATTMFYGALAILVAGFATLSVATLVVNVGTLFAFFMVILATWVFRVRRPDVERPFRMPMWSLVNVGGRPLLPVFVLLGLVGTAALIISLGAFTLWAAVTWAGLGLLVYAFYGVRHSREAGERVEALTPRPKVRPVKAAAKNPSDE